MKGRIIKDFFDVILENGLNDSDTGQGSGFRSVCKGPFVKPILSRAMATLVESFRG